jgi:hypothetical protein
LEGKRKKKHGTWSEIDKNLWVENCEIYVKEITYIFKKYSSISSCQTNMSKYSQCEYNKAKYYKKLKNSVYEASYYYFYNTTEKNALSTLIKKYENIYQSKENEHLKKMKEHCSRENSEKICNNKKNNQNKENKEYLQNAGKKPTKKTTTKKPKK